MDEVSIELDVRYGSKLAVELLGQDCWSSVTMTELHFTPQPPAEPGTIAVIVIAFATPLLPPPRAILLQR
ncbi:hypothetical protein FRC03_001773 [Tulasnella sp. 419]|nr:hypothetical protein FRC03_001773 [Tulasnella sp. 419]